MRRVQTLRHAPARVCQGRQHWSSLRNVYKERTASFLLPNNRTFTSHLPCIFASLHMRVSGVCVRACVGAVYQYRVLV